MDYINVYANGKINIGLDIVGKREDGYHDLKTIMQSIRLHDKLYIKKIYTPKIKIVTNLKWLPIDERNLVYKACDLLFSKYKPDKGVYIELTKNIPVSAGLGGGSADCAATLFGIRRLFNFPISNNELMEIGASLGADVPFCLQRGTMLAEGIGDRLTRLDNHPPVYILLAKPNISISTPKIFSEFDNEKVKKRPDIDGMIKDLEKGDIEGLSHKMVNVLEEVTIKKFPIIDSIKKSMIEQGAMGSLMTGSGPTVFGYFDSRDKAYNGLRYIRKKYKLREVYVTEVFNIGRTN